MARPRHDPYLQMQSITAGSPTMSYILTGVLSTSCAKDAESPRWKLATNATELAILVSVTPADKVQFIQIKIAMCQIGLSARLEDGRTTQNPNSQFWTTARLLYGRPVQTQFITVDSRTMSLRSIGVRSDL